MFKLVTNISNSISVPQKFRFPISFQNWMIWHPGASFGWIWVELSPSAGACILLSVCRSPHPSLSSHETKAKHRLPFVIFISFYSQYVCLSLEHFHLLPLPSSPQTPLSVPSADPTCRANSLPYSAHCFILKPLLLIIQVQREKFSLN